MIRISPFVSLFVATLALAAPTKRYGEQTDAEHLASFTAAHESGSLAEKLERNSRPFVGTTYGFSPLGEGSGIDADPRLRWDVVDCLTFVETSIALTEAPSFEQLLPLLDDIRYATVPPAFNRRNHFVESEWVPNNLAKGYIRSIAKDIAGDAALTVSKAFGPELWRKDRHPEGLQLEPQDIPAGTFPLEIVPLAFARKNSAAIPNGTLLMVVRQDLPNLSTRVSHVGFVVEKEGKRYLRHASKEPYGRVIDEPLDKFFSRNAQYTKWPVEGFALFQLQVPADRIAQLGRVVAAAPAP